MVRRVSGPAADSAYVVRYSNKEIENVLKIADRVARIAQESDRYTANLLQLGRRGGVRAAAFRSIARKMAKVGVDAIALEREIRIRMDRAIDEVAAIAEQKSIDKLETARRQTGRAEQPEAFLNVRGRPIGTRIRLRKSIHNGVQIVGSRHIAVRIGLLADLNKAVDRRGRPVWQAVELPWAKGGPPRGGVFLLSGTAAGAGSGDAVFAPSSRRPSMQPKKLHKGYFFLREGRNYAYRSLTDRLNRIAIYGNGKIRDLDKRVIAISQEITKAQSIPAPPRRR